MLEKNWDKSMEKQLYEGWKDRFQFHEDSRPVFSIDTPPPYVNTPIHIGHAATYTLMDMFARFHRMIGHNVIFPLGLDRNGLPIEMATEKRFGVSMNDVSREEFISLCKKMLEEASAESIDSFMKLGISFNSWQPSHKIGGMYMTDSNDYRTVTQATFIDMWEKGLVYEDDRINNYCPGCKTTLADAEVDYDEKQSLFNDLIFTVKETNEKITIGTTRPELIGSCAMVIFNPEDKRYTHLNGKHAVTPVFNKIVPIMAHTQAEMEKGTGLVMMCAFGDQADIRFFREQNIQPILSINQDGRMNENAGLLKGLTVAEARKRMIEILKNHNLIESQKKMMHRTPICERSKDPIEFIAMKEYYLRQVEFKEEMRKIAESINFFAPQSRQILLDWIESVSIDWPISRRRYYATEIPLWHCRCGEKIIPPKGSYYRPWKEAPPISQCHKCGSTSFKGEERVFDTWFDSANSPLYVLQYERDNAFFAKHFPCSLRPQGKEIVRTWLYYTLLKGYLLTKKQAFHDTWIHYHIVDEKGTKMSKSIGNVIDPHIILEKYGAEPFRLWCALEGNLEKDDMRCSFERIEGAGKTLTKLWNVAKFVQQFPWTKIMHKDVFDPDIAKIDLAPLDKWIISEISQLASYTRERYEKYDFHNPGIQLRHFLWETFASHYLELAKSRAYNQSGIFTESEQNSAVFTLHYCLSTWLKLMYPAIPFITKKLYEELYRADIDMEKFPHIARLESDMKTEDIVELNNTVWKAKKDNQLSLKSEISSLELPHVFSHIEKDVKATHGAKHVSYGKSIKVTI